MNNRGKNSGNDGSSGNGLPATPDPAATSAGTPRPERFRWVAFALALTLLTAGAAVWASTRLESGPAASRTGTTSSSSASAPAANDSASPTDTPQAQAPAATTAPPTPAPEAPAEAKPAEPPAAGPAPAKPGDPAPVDRRNKSDEELATIEQPVARPVPLAETKVVKSGVSATISELQAVEGEATGIGEVAGPALRFKVTVVNNTAAEISLDTAVINVSYGADNSPASSLSGPDTVPFPATVPAGSSAVGVFVFGVPKDARNAVKIYLNLDAETPIAAFEGQAPA